MAPVAALVAAAISGEPLLANWTQTFMGGAAALRRAVVPVVPARWAVRQAHGRQRVGQVDRAVPDRTVGHTPHDASVVLASAAVTYGGVSVFVAFFVLVPMAEKMFRAANIPRRLMPATIGLGAFTFTMSGSRDRLRSTMPSRCRTSARRPSPLPVSASSRRSSSSPSACGGSAGPRRPRARPARAMARPESALAVDEKTREQATTAGDFDPAEIDHGKRGDERTSRRPRRVAPRRGHRHEFPDGIGRAPAPRFFVPRRGGWGGTTIGAVAGIWSVVLALAAAGA